MQLRPFHVTGRDGTTLAAYECSPPKLRNPVPVVLQHGFAASSESNWIAPGIVSALLNDDRLVYLLDARGHGQSEKPQRPESYSHRQMATDVSALIDVLANDGTTTMVDFVGYSMGGWIGMHLLTTDPRIRRAVIAGVGVAAGERSVERDPRDPVDRSKVALALEAFADDPTSKIADAGARQFAKFAASNGGDLRALAALMRSPDPSPTGVRDIDIPVLVMAGELDDLAATAPDLAAQIRNAQMIFCPGTHLSAIEEPSFAAGLVSFLAKGA